MSRASTPRPCANTKFPKPVWALTLALVLLVAGSSPAAPAGSRPPNLIVILVDDLGCDWVSAYGAAHPTPNIDRLAAGGVRFENFWVTPLCSPTRVSLLTGQYGFRSGWASHYDVPASGGRGLRADRFTTIARPLRDAGYATGIAGKWHVHRLSEQPGALQEHGFNEHRVWPGWEPQRPHGSSNYWDATLVTNGEWKTYPGGFGPDLLDEFARDFLKRHRERPFFLYYPMITAHDPLVLTPLNRERPPTNANTIFAGMVTYADVLVGRLLNSLDTLGLASNTVVLLLGDNGSPRGGRLGGQVMPGDKGRVTDLGVHVPLLIRAPSVSVGGRVRDDLTDLTDIYPTLLEFAGIPQPSGMAVDGISLVPVLRDERREHPRGWIFSALGRSRTVRDKRFKLDSAGGFFDLLSDPAQTNDLRSSSAPDHILARNRLATVLRGLPADAPPPWN